MALARCGLEEEGRDYTIVCRGHEVVEIDPPGQQHPGEDVIYRSIAVLLLLQPYRAARGAAETCLSTATPMAAGQYYPLYDDSQRGTYRGGATRWVEVERFLPAKAPRW